MKYVIIAVCIVCTLFTQNILAQDQDSGVQTDSTYQNSYTFLPAIGSSPETSMLFGGVGIRQFKPGNASFDTRPSFLVLSGIYTLNNQLIIGLGSSIILNHEEWILEGNYSLKFFPDSYWGIGNKTVNSDEMMVDYKEYFLMQSVQKKIAPDMFLGPIARWTRTTDFSFEDPEGNGLPIPDDRGSSGSTTAGVGVNYSWDSRNSRITPTENHFLQLMMMTYPGFLGTTHPYSVFLIDGRKYFDLSSTGSTVIAFQSRTSLIAGKPSFMDMSFLGGDNFLRGFHFGRFRDNNSSQMQAELRQHVFWRIGFSVFAGAGEVWHSFNDFKLDNLKFAAGGGLRLNINKYDTTNIRIDYGIGRNTSGFYLTIGEAF